MPLNKLQCRVLISSNSYISRRCRILANTCSDYLTLQQTAPPQLQSCLNPFNILGLQLFCRFFSSPSLRADSQSFSYQFNHDRRSPSYKLEVAKGPGKIIGLTIYHPSGVKAEVPAK